jgi:hypothetical protein
MRKAKVAPSCSAHSEADLILYIGVCSWKCDSDVFFCFDNDMKVHAPLISNGSSGVQLDKSTK